MDELKQFAELVSSIGWFPVVIFTLWKTGVLKIPYVRNGNGDVKKLEGQIESLKSNHLHELSEKLDKIIEQNNAHLQMERENRFFLEEVIKRLDRKG